MMKKRGEIEISKIIVSMILVIAVIHTGYVLISTLPQENIGSAISGRAIGDNGILENIIINYTEMSALSKAIIGIEWLLIITIITIVLIREKITLSKDMSKINISLNIPRYKKIKPKTDLDVLYEILKEKKSLRVSGIQKLFNVDKKVVMEWYKILEEGDLATIRYHTVGEPEIEISGQLNVQETNIKPEKTSENKAQAHKSVEDPNEKKEIKNPAKNIKEKKHSKKRKKEKKKSKFLKKKNTLKKKPSKKKKVKANEKRKSRR